SRCDGADRDRAGLRAADTVEDVLLIAGGEDAVERGLRRAHDVDTADELVRAAVDVDAIDDERDHLEGLRRAAGRQGEAGGDVLKVQTIRFALALGFGYEHAAKLGLGHSFGGGDDEIALAAGRHVANLGAAVAVALLDAGDRQPGHEEGLENAVLNKVDAACRLP